MVDDSRSVILKAFKRVKLTVNKRISSRFMPWWILKLPITNNTLHTFGIQRLYVVSNLKFPCITGEIQKSLLSPIRKNPTPKNQNKKLKAANAGTQEPTKPVIQEIQTES